MCNPSRRNLSGNKSLKDHPAIFAFGIIMLAWLAAAPAPVAGAQPEPSPPFTVKTADGNCAITINTAQAPELQDWAVNQLAPVLVEWYPKIVALLPSEGFTAPTHFNLTLKPMDGVAYTSGTEVVANSSWLLTQLHGEAIGSLVHEMVHVVQQFDGDNPGWLVEGTADYVRWFKYEPQTHGADLVWLRRLRHFTPRYDASYRLSANFLDWVAKTYDQKIVTQLNAAMRADKYDESLWVKCTGKTVQQLGAEWKQAIEAQITPPSTAGDAPNTTN